MNRRGFLTALIGGTVASAVTAETAYAQYYVPPPHEWEDRRDRYDRYRRDRYEGEREWERERRRRYYRRRWRDDEDEDD